MLQAVSERLVSRGHQVTVFTTNATTQPEMRSSRGGNLPRHEVLNGVMVRRFPTDPLSARVTRGLLGLRGGWRASSWVFGEGVTMLRRLPAPHGLIGPVLRARADVVVSANWIWPAAYGVHLARRIRPFRLVGLPILHVARAWADQPLFRPMLARCDSVLTLTPAEQDFVRQRGARRAHVVGAGADPSAFEHRDGTALRAKLGLGTSPVIGFVGRQDFRKGVLALLEAMHLVWRCYPEARLLLAGQQAHRSPEVITALAAVDPDRRNRIVEVSDFVERDGPSILDACDIVALPSVEESFGLVFLEAWMCRKPVVGARIPSSECLIEPGVDGLLAAPLDGPDLAQCLLQLLGSPELRAAMGERGYRKVLAHHTWDLVTDRWEAALGSTVGDVEDVEDVENVEDGRR